MGTKSATGSGKGEETSGWSAENQSGLFRDAYDAGFVDRLVARLGRVAEVGALPSLQPPTDAWVASLREELPSLAMKARVGVIVDAVEAWAGARSPQAWCELAVAWVETDAPWTGFAVWPATTLVERHGPHAPAAALDALEALTTRFTGEFAIRPILQAAPDVVWPRLAAWVHHPNEHVRRLVSEGTRTRLPWGVRLHGLIRDPSPVWPLLEALRNDPSSYVRRSVANHLNDLSRDHPEEVIRCAARWMAEIEGDEKSGKAGGKAGGKPGGKADGSARVGEAAVDAVARRALVRHALRTLVKQGNSAALEVLGFGGAALEVLRFEVSPVALRIGGKVRWTAVLRAPESGGGRAVVDVAVDFVRAKGRTSRKVFKGAVVDVAPGEELVVSRTLPFRSVSVRRLYPGQHLLTVQVDGVEMGQVSVMLEA